MSKSKKQQKHFYLRNNDALMNSTKLSMKAKQSILLSKAENTVDAYESDWDDFVDWCTYQKVSYFPATPETIVNYINDLADYAKANTISRRISAISENFNASGQGVEIFVASSKADQEGQGAVVAIPHLSGSPLDAVRALQQWLRASGITEGPVFRGFTKNMSIRKTAISDKMIAEIVKKYISLIGLDPTMYGAHSLRHGFATTAAAYGVEERNIMRQTRHHSVNMVRRYINEANKFVDNPISTIFEKRFR